MDTACTGTQAAALSNHWDSRACSRLITHGLQNIGHAQELSHTGLRTSAMLQVITHRFQNIAMLQVITHSFQNIAML